MSEQMKKLKQIPKLVHTPSNQPTDNTTVPYNKSKKDGQTRAISPQVAEVPLVMMEEEEDVQALNALAKMTKSILNKYKCG